MLNFDLFVLKQASLKITYFFVGYSQVALLNFTFGILIGVFRFCFRQAGVAWSLIKQLVAPPTQIGVIATLIGVVPASLSLWVSPLQPPLNCPFSQVEFEVGFLEWSACCAFLMQLCQGANKFMWPNMRVCVCASVSVCVCVHLSVSLAICAATSLFLCTPSYCLAALINGERKLMRFCVPFLLLLLLLLCVATALLLFCFIVSSCGPNCLLYPMLLTDGYFRQTNSVFVLYKGI